MTYLTSRRKLPSLASRGSALLRAENFPLNNHPMVTANFVIGCPDWSSTTFPSITGYEYSGTSPTSARPGAIVKPTYNRPGADTEPTMDPSVGRARIRNRPLASDRATRVTCLGKALGTCQEPVPIVAFETGRPDSSTIRPCTDQPLSSLMSSGFICEETVIHVTAGANPSA